MTTPNEPIYDPNVPQFLNDSFAVTQKSLLENFLTLFNASLRNHQSINFNTFPMYHTKIELLNQLTPLETNVSEINVYTKLIQDNVDALPNQMTIRYQGNGQEFSYIPYQIYPLSLLPTNTDYFTFLPGNFIVYFGSFPAGDPKKLEPRIFNLNPPIAKKIASVTFTPLGIVPMKIPYVDILPEENGYFTKLTIVDSNNQASAPPACFYVVIANI